MNKANRKMKVIYVAGPYRAKTPWKIEQNIRIAEEHSLAIWQTGKAAVICPHTMCRFYQGSARDEVWLNGDLELLSRCDAIYMLPRSMDSEGAKIELAKAIMLNMRIFTYMAWDKLIEWLNEYYN